MKIDITLEITPEIMQENAKHLQVVFMGHMGTHFDVMDKTFPLAFLERKAVVFDISHVDDGEVSIDDVDFSKVESDMFVAFYSGYIENVGYGTEKYGRQHPTLAKDFIDALLEKKISIIGIDFAGIRRGAEHSPMDQYCADHGVFVIENLCNLQAVLEGEKQAAFVAHTYPMNYKKVSGLPCRVIAEK